MLPGYRSGLSTPTASSASIRTTQKPVPNNSKYELHHSVSELFRILNVEESNELNRETIAERFEKNIGHQSKKPFSLFFSRLSDNRNFLEKYHPLKCQNLNEVDPFVRFIVRVREDKNMNNFFNNFQDISRSRSFKYTNGGSAVRCPSQPPAMYRKSASTSKVNRPTSASSAFLALATQQDLAMSPKTPLKPANSNEPTLATPIMDDSIRNSHNESIRTAESIKTGSSNHQAINRKIPIYVSRDFHPCDWPKENDPFNTLGTHSVQEQEQLLLRDLLFMLIGIEGRYIRLTKSSDSTRYKLLLDPSADHFLAVTTNRILKICYHYSAIVTFVESRVYGLVNQALVAFIHQHLYDYNMTVCQMEDMFMKNDLFLQKMFFILLPYFSTFSRLKEICAKLYKNKSVGGAVLTLLHEKTKSIQGMDNNSLELCLNMTKSAAIPYFDILKTWIYYGEISDPRKEFFIEDTHTNHTGSSTPATGPVNSNASGNQNDDIESDDEYDDDFGKFNDKYWDNRYRINGSKTPCFLKQYEQTIYKTGKYISIINKVKQLFLKSSKVIPIPQSLNPTATVVSATNANTDTYKPSSIGGSSSFMFLNNYGTPLSTHINQNNNLLTVAETHSLASMASSSSSNTSHSTGGPTPSAAIFTPKPEEIYYSFDETTYLSPIMSAYDEASSQLLHILIHESQLVETFNAVKHYMLLSMGDFIVHFLKFASKDLCKRTDSVVQHRLDSMMGMALGISVCHSDRQYLKDDPHVEFVGKSLLKQIYQIMKPFDDSGQLKFLPNDPSPSSSYLLRCDDDAADEDDDDDVNLNRSIINSVIEAGSGDNYLNEVDSKVRTPKYVGGSRPKNTEPVTKSKSEQRKLFCYESLTLKFDVPFPLSLIFTQKSILCYELLFRYFFLCRYAEMELEETWKDNILTVQLKRCDTQSLLTQLTNQQPEPEENTDTAKLMAKTFKSIHKKAFALRYKMLAFVRNFHYFYAFEVIDPFFAQFIGQITKRGSSLDSVIECHEKFLEHCFSSCFLTSIEITTIIIKIFTLCIELSHALRDSIDVEDQSSMMESSCFFGSDQPRNKDLPDAEIHEKLDRIYFNRRRSSGSTSLHSSAISSSRRPSCTIMEIVEKANNEFNSLVSQLLKKIYSDNCEYHMMYPFVARLDYNDFYRNQILD